MKRISLISLLVCVNFWVYAQKNEIRFTSYSVQHGLSQSTVNCILQDRRGFMWFGTWDGLNRFDGYNFKVYKPEAGDSFSISSNAINTIFEDQAGRLWIGTDGGGLNCFNYETERFIHYKNIPDNPASISSNKVKAILEDHLGNFWIGTTDGGLNLMNREKGTFIAYRHKTSDPNSISSDNIWTLYEDSKGDLYIGNFTDGLNRFDRNKNQFVKFNDYYNEHPVLEYTVVRTIMEDRKGNMWFGTYHGGLILFDRKNMKFKLYKHDPADSNSISNTRVEKIMEDTKGNLWVATFGGGLNLFDPVTGKFVSYQYDITDPFSISGNRIWSMFEDRSGVIWVGCSGAGVNKFNPNKKKFVNYTNQSWNPGSISNSTVSFVFVDKYQNVWAATYNGLNLLSPERNTFKRAFYRPAGPDYLFKMTSIHNNVSDNLWIGYDGAGVQRIKVFARDSFRIMFGTGNFSDDLGKNTANVRMVYEDSRGNLWIGLYAGGLHVAKVKDLGEKPVTIYPIPVFPLNDATVFSILEDSQGVMWFGTRSSGVTMYNPRTNKKNVYSNILEDSTSISNNTINHIYETKSKVMCFATGQGLNIFDRKTGKFTRFDMKKGLPSNLVMCIVEDDKGNLWLGTDYGLCRFNLKTHEVKNYSKEDGIADNGFSPGAAAKAADGRLYFGCGKGMVAFYPDSIRDNPDKPPVVLTNFLIYNKPVPIGYRNATRIILPKAITETNELRLSYRENVFSFEFAALDFIAPEKNRYAYKLIGFDDDWNYVQSDRRFVTYTNLNPGEYLLHIRASNNDGVWNDDGLKLSIIIIPPVYRRWWFIVLLFLLIGYTVYKYITIRFQHIRRDKDILQARIEEAVSEVELQKEELVAKNQELMRSKELEALQNWFNQGLAQFSELLGRDRDDIHALLKRFIKNLVQYINANQGCVCLLNEDDENDRFLELVAGYGISRFKTGRRFMIGEGLIGACFIEKEATYIEIVPDDYFTISSALGEEKPRGLLLIPLKYNEMVIGVLEVGSLNKLSSHCIDFAKRITENLAYTIIVMKTNEHTQKILNRTRDQAQLLASNEEELRQNLEEMNATQEEMQKRESDLQHEINELRRKLSEMEHLRKNNN